MSETSPSLETIQHHQKRHEQRIKAYEKRKAGHVHSKMSRTSPTKIASDNPLIDHLEHQIRIEEHNLLSPEEKKRNEVVNDPKTVGMIRRSAERQYQQAITDFQKINDAKEEAEELKYDGLTKESKVFTRHSGDVAFQTAINDAIRNKQSIGLLMVDHDWFKLVNDSYGHPAGDLVIQEIAATLRNLTRRRNDFIIRYGGEEFAVIFPAITVEKLREKADLIEKIYDQRQQVLRGPANPVFDTRRTISRGITYLDPFDPRIQGKENGAIVDLLYKEADDALLAAKEMGRNQTQDYRDIDDKFKKNTLSQAA